MTGDLRPGRNDLVRRGRMLAWLTIAWNSREGVAAVFARVMAGSIALVGFGADSYRVFAGAVGLIPAMQAR